MPLSGRSGKCKVAAEMNGVAVALTGLHLPIADSRASEVDFCGWESLSQSRSLQQVPVALIVLVDQTEMGAERENRGQRDEGGGE